MSEKTFNIRKRLTAGVAAAMFVLAPLLAGSGAAQGGAQLLVNDAQTANPALVAVDVADPAGLGVTGLTLQAPEGSEISVIASGLQRPRFMAFDDAGNLLVAESGAGQIVRYPLADGVLGDAEVLASGLEQPGNVALFTDGDQEYLYVSEPQQISRFAYDPAGPVGEQEAIVSGLPTGGHSTRTVRFGPDGMMYLAVGSSCNICVEEDPVRATVSRMTPQGGSPEILATGLRNPVDLAFQPGTDLLWATVNERDNQGNEMPPDLVTIVQEGANYGWPYCQPPAATPQEAGADCSNITPPTVGIQPHSAPLGMTFLVGDGVPADLNGDLVVAQHGSWNREPPAAPKLLRIDFEDGQPVAAADLVAGWQNAAGERWGRPAGVTLAPDGSLIVSDDLSGVIYRVVLAE
ncbi:MAG: PQQ-dependent sugar dehydrogenase [Thermomicrobiales bacterium]